MRNQAVDLILRRVERINELRPRNWNSQILELQALEKKSGDAQTEVVLKTPRVQKRAGGISRGEDVEQRRESGAKEKARRDFECGDGEDGDLLLSLSDVEELCFGFVRRKGTGLS